MTNLVSGFTYNKKVSTSIGNDYDGAKFYYTRNSYDISFFNGGKAEKTESRKYQQNISDVTYTPPTRPAGVPANFTFAGWYDNELCEGTAYVFTGTMPAKGITLYAKWQAPQVNATVYLSASADSNRKHSLFRMVRKSPSPKILTRSLHVLKQKPAKHRLHGSL